MAVNDSDSDQGFRIEIESDGPYRVYGNVPLVRKTQVVSEFGEPLTWKKEGTIETSGTYFLCRCGHSSDKPFCDLTHLEIDFNGKETASTDTTAQRQVTLPGGPGVVVKRDYSLCMDAGFCGNRFRRIDDMLAESGNTEIRSQVIAMVERCPSGSYVYSTGDGQAEIEPDLPPQIAVMTEITDDGPIAGPLWVTGNIKIIRSDGKPFETRNRVTLCNCGRSQNKPLCDGTHREP